MNYKLFMPRGAKEIGENIILENGLSFPKYAFIAVPIVGFKSNISSDLLSDVENREIFYEVKTNKFTFNKKLKNIEQNNKNYSDYSLTDIKNNGLIKFNFDGYINISNLISNIKKQINNIKEKDTNLLAFEQDIGYTTVRENNLFPFEIALIEETDNFENLDYQLSSSLKLRDLLVYNLKNQTLNPQYGVSKKIIVKNLKNIAINIVENIKNYITTNFEILSAFTNNIYYTPDAEFYIGEGIELRFPGMNHNSVYLIAKDLLNSLFFNKLYLNYYLDKDPTITIITNSENDNFEFGTRFENNILHPNKLVNIDKNFSIDSENSVLDLSIQFNKLNYNTDKLVMENFIKDAIDKNYITSSENAIKLAFLSNLNISNVTVSDYTATNIDMLDEFFDPINFDIDIYEQNDENSKNLNNTISNYLPSMIKCPTVSNGSVNGKPPEKLFPMLSNVAFKSLTDLTMLYNPSKTSGQNSIPKNIKFNNPLLAPVIKGVTDKVEDGYIGQMSGKAVYSNRIGGLIAGLRHMESKNLNSKSLKNGLGSIFGPGILSKIFSKLSNALFDVKDPSGMMLNCIQFDSNDNINNQAVIIGMLISSISNEAKSSMSYDEIIIALEHLKGDKKQFNKTIDGNDIGNNRDTSKEYHLGISKIDQSANSKPIDISNTIINSVKALIEDGNGTDIETKTERKQNQIAEYIKYDSNGDHNDYHDTLGSYLISSNLNKKDEIFK